MRDGIVTGEGVVIDARPASFATRTLAIALDLIALFIGVWLFGLLIGLMDLEIDPSLMQIFAIVAIVSLTVVIPTTIETLSRGRSLGKAAMGIRVTRDDGGPVRFRQAFIRALVGVGELWMSAGSVALIASLSNDRGKRLGDLLAGTYVVRTRGAAMFGAQISMPPHLAGWAQHADMRRLPDGLALAARQFLARTESLEQGARVRLGQDLAAQLESFVAPGPPPGTHPELFIVAVLAERRNRDWVAASRAKQLAQEQEQTLHRLPYSIPDPIN